MPEDRLAQLLMTQAWQIAVLTIIVASVGKLLTTKRPRLAHLLWLTVVNGERRFHINFVSNRSVHFLRTRIAGRILIDDQQMNPLFKNRLGMEFRGSIAAAFFLLRPNDTMRRK